MFPNGKKNLFIFEFGIPLLFACLVVLAFGDARAGSENPIGPYTEIQLPLEDLPALNEGLVYHPVIDTSDLSIVNDLDSMLYDSGAVLQVLYVLEDPRDVPLARYASNTGSGVFLPEENLINKDNLKTINVYVRLQAQPHRAARDPILSSELIDLDWPALYVVPLSYEMEGVPTFPCAPVEYADGTTPYRLPAGIDGGEAVREDGLYDPAAYAPPKPWYYGEDPQLEQGEVREGWVSCLAPDIPLEQLQVKYRHTFIPEPEIMFTDDPALQGEPYPDKSELEMIGLTIDDIPQTFRECAEMDYCVESYPSCGYSANEAGLKKGLCVTVEFDYVESEDGGIIAYPINGPEDEISGARVFTVMEHTEIVQQSYLLWNYTVSRSYPVSLIRVDDIPITFMDEDGNLLRDTGSAIFHDPVVDYTTTGINVSEYVPGVDGDDKKEVLDRDGYAFFSRVVVEPKNLSREAVEGYQLSMIGVRIDILVEHEGIPLSGVHNSNEINRYFVQPGDPFEGIIYSGIRFELDLELEDEYKHLRHKAYGTMLPGTALIGIHPVPDEFLSVGTRISFHPVNVVNRFKNNLVAETTMCDVVDCVDVTIPRYELMPPRPVPVMCAGEWANNFIIDGGDLVPVMYYIGEAWGTSGNKDYLHIDFKGWENQSKVVLYEGRVMGGAAPWWLYGTSQDGLFGRIIGHVVDLETSIPLDNDAYITHYYSRVDRNDLSQGYFAPADWRPLSNKGWIENIADEKVLIFGTINPYDDARFEALNDSNTGFLFHEEGPIWVTECQRQTISTLADPELYTQPNTAGASPVEGGEHWIKELLDGMDYPPSLPVIKEEVIPLGEFTDPFSRDGNYRIAIKNIRIVPGRPDVPIVYVKSDDSYYPAEKNPNIDNEVFFQRSGAVAIPPDTSYVRVEVSVDFIDDGDRFATNCSLEQQSFQLVYPGFLPITGIGDRIRDPLWPCDNKDYSTWINFLFPSLDVDPNIMLLSLHMDSEDPWYFLSLSDD